MERSEKERAKGKVTTEEERCEGRGERMRINKEASLRSIMAESDPAKPWLKPDRRWNAAHAHSYTII